MEINEQFADLTLLKNQEEYLAEKRKLFLWGGVDDRSVERLVKRMMYLDSISDAVARCVGGTSPCTLLKPGA